MDWSRIKSIFIMAFLILDIFLLFWLREKQVNENRPYMDEASFEEKLEAEGIVVENVPTDVNKNQFYIKATSKDFSKEEKEILSQKNQQVTVKEGVNVLFGQPIPINFEVTQDNMAPILEATVLYGDQYRFWGFNEEKRTIVYYQTYKEFTLYNNQSGKITFQINEKNEITGYTQTMLDSFEENKEQVILEPMKALETLYSSRKIKENSTVNKVELGYYTLFQQPSQVLAPTWYFQVNKEENYFVNAIDGRIIEMDDQNTTTE